MSEDSDVLIAENRNTSNENSPIAELKEIKTIRIIANFLYLDCLYKAKIYTHIHL